MKKLTLLVICYLFILLSTLAQPIVTKGKFLDDSIKLGYPVKYSLTVIHAPETSVLFPDSSFNYYPFELISKEYYPTKTTNGTSKDSAVYILRSFETKRVQSLALPAYVDIMEDSAAAKSNLDSVYLVEYLPESPINETFKEETSLNKINKSIDYPWIAAYSIIGLLIGLIIYFFFGRTIRRRIRLVTIRIDHNKFIKGFHKLEEDYSDHKGASTLERSVSTWKVYLSKLENKPINTYTTTELLNLFNQEDLKNNLDIIDKAIYGGVVSEDTVRALTSLRRFSVRQYHKRRKEIQDV